MTSWLRRRWGPLWLSLSSPVCTHGKDKQLLVVLLESERSSFLRQVQASLITREVLNGCWQF